MEYSVTDYASWWETARDPKDELEEKHRASQLMTTVQDLERTQSAVHQQNLWNARLYSNREIAAFDWGTGSAYTHNLAPVSFLGENLVLMIVDTLMSMVGKNPTKPVPTPHGASIRVKRNAALLDQWLYGEYIRLRAYEMGKDIFRDSLLYGFGVVRVDFDAQGRLIYVPLFPDNVLIDQHEAVACHGQYRHIYERECLPVDVIESTWNLPTGSLKAVKPELASSRTYADYRKVGKDHAVVVRGYRAARNGKPGRVVVSCENKILYDKPWPYEWLPHVVYRFNKPADRGFYAQSVVEQALPFQIRLNEILEVIRDAQDLMARPRIFVAEGSRVNPQDFDNLVGRIIKYTGLKPEAMNWPAVSAELYAERDHQIQSCFQQFGISQMVGQSKMPAGMRYDSSKALNAATQISDDRTADPLQRLERFYLDLAETSVRMMSAKYGKHGGEKGKGYSTVSAIGGKGPVKRIHWDEIDLDEQAYTLTMEPASVFSMSVANRIDTVEGWLRDQKITPEEYRRMVAHPDLEGEASIQAAAAKNCDHEIDRLMRGEYRAPSELQDVVQLVQRVTLAYLELDEYDDVTDEIRDNFVKYIAACQAILEKGTETPPQAAMPQQPMMPMAPAAPMGPMPMMPPQGMPIIQ